VEDPTAKDALTGELGDGDPIDVVEIGAQAHATGAVRAVKVLGALAMIDQGETDWKVIAIDTADPLAASIHCPSLHGAFAQ
jgi:inorganic pyrophosphatase